MPRIGRWASPDPLWIHATGGGEAMNAYHYVSGNLLQARDPLGLCGDHSIAAHWKCAGPLSPVTWLVDNTFGSVARLADETSKRVTKHTGSPLAGAVGGAAAAVGGVFGLDAPFEAGNAADDVRQAGFGNGRGWRLAVSVLGTGLGQKAASRVLKTAWSITGSRLFSGISALVKKNGNRWIRAFRNPKIEGQPGMSVHNRLHAAREVLGAELLASRTDVSRVYAGDAAELYIYGSQRPPGTLDVDAVAITREGNFHLMDAKGNNIEHALDQFAEVGEALRATNGGHVTRQTLVVPAPDQLRGGYYVNEGVLHHSGEAVRVNGHTIEVVGASE